MARDSFAEVARVFANGDENMPDTVERAMRLVAEVTRDLHDPMCECACKQQTEAELAAECLRRLGGGK
jgi:hypothetical protein